jgi:hypothetical protein
MKSVLQDWVMALPLREQGTLVVATRGCDVTPKRPLDSWERRLTGATRWAVMNPADPREVDIPGAFFQSAIPTNMRTSDLAHYPTHWLSHAMHACEVIGYRHPDPDVARQFLSIYRKFCKMLHVNPETCEQMIARLGEDRIASDEVVS